MELNTDDNKQTPEGGDAQPKADEQPEKVENPEGVLRKNKELLAAMKEQKEAAQRLEQELADYKAREAAEEAKRLEKKGDYEKLLEKRKAEFDAELQKREERIAAMFNTMAEKDLQLAIPSNVIDELREPFAIILRAKHIQPVEEDGRTVWKSLDGLERYDDLPAFIKSLESDPAYGNFFKGDNHPGSNAPGNKGRVTGGTLQRSKMTTAEKTAYIKKHGQAAFLQLPN